MMRLSEAAVATQGQVIGQDILFASVGSDSRNIVPQQLFVALQGERFDGHTYAAQAIAQGAAAALVSQASALPAALLVKDTRLALGDLATYWRQKMGMPVVAITGSNGKTSVKEMLASILRHAVGDEAVLATQGNLNNDIGLPMTLLNLRQKHQYAVVEMGMNHMGEIAYLSKIGRPNIALINNAGTAHIGELGSIEAIAQAKGEIFQGLAEGGIAIINADDVFAPYWKGLVGSHAVMTFGLSAEADVTAQYELHANASTMTLRIAQASQVFELPVAGLHNVRNALAAAAAATALGLSIAQIATGLTAFGGVKGRLQQQAGLNGARIIDDTYNANPSSMKAAIDVLAVQSGQKIMVMGDMGELGQDAAQLHAEIGAYAKQAGLDGFFTMGELSQQAAKAFGASAQHFTEIAPLAEHIGKQLHDSTTVLVKGSRFMQMERVVKLITANNQQQHSPQEKR